MNTTTYVRSPKNKKHPFTKISNSIAKLPAAEAGIMLQILLNSDDWVINKEIVRKRSGLGRDKFDRVWKHLQELNYIVLKKRPIENGKFSYHYTIYENPSVQNSTMDIHEPYTGNRTTETRTTGNHTTVTGGTNNYQIINEDQKTICSSGSDGLSTKVGVRPGNNNTRPNMLGQENKNEIDLQIVPPPSLCCGEGRDDLNRKNQGPAIKSSLSEIEDISIAPHPSLRCGEVRDDFRGPKEDQMETLSTNEKEHESLSSEYHIPRGAKLSIEDKYLIEGLPEEPTEMLKAMIDDEYKEKVPNWETILFQNSFIRAFFERTEKMVKPNIFLAEVVTEYFKRVKNNNY